MTNTEHAITRSFTIDHAKGTLKEILSNIDEQLNDSGCELNKGTLNEVHKYLTDAIGEIDKAKACLNKAK